MKGRKPGVVGEGAAICAVCGLHIRTGRGADDGQRGDGKSVDFEQGREGLYKKTNNGSTQ